jgi:thiamine-monophosphate kinase
VKKNLEDIFINGVKNSYIGDDAALVDGLLYSQDAFFEGVHFRREWMRLEQIGYKAMIVNISDAVAMNAKPLYALLTVALPKDFSTQDARSLQRGVKKACKQYGISIVGGDTISNTKLDLSVTIISKSDSPLYRKGVQKGDILAFTGTLGSCKKDLDKLLNNDSISPSSKFIKPVLSSKFIYNCSKYLNAGMDISDGLFFELDRLSKINKVGFEFFKPISQEVGCSGEEYEMLVAFAPENLAKVLEIAKQTKTKITPFAHAVKGRYECSCKPWHFG